jgi:hypothetical protein
MRKLIIVSMVVAVMSLAWGFCAPALTDFLSRGLGREDWSVSGEMSLVP